MPAVEENPRILVSTATYNEKENLAALVQSIRETVPQAHILITDDNSPDGTGQLADQLAAADPQVHVIHRAGKLGLGTAIVAAIRYAIDNNYDYFVNMDADFSHHPKYLPAILAMMKDHDVVIGSRYVPGGGSENWPFSRRAMSRSVNVMVRLLMRLKARDCSGGYRCYRVSKLREVPWERMRSRGYSFQQEVLYRCRKVGCRIGESPIIFADRRAGTSKVNPREAARSIWMLVRLGVPAFLGMDS